MADEKRPSKKESAPVARKPESRASETVIDFVTKTHSTYAEALQEIARARHQQSIQDWEELQSKCTEIQRNLRERIREAYSAYLKGVAERVGQSADQAALHELYSDYTVSLAEINVTANDDWNQAHLDYQSRLKESCEKLTTAKAEAFDAYAQQFLAGFTAIDVANANPEFFLHASQSMQQAVHWSRL